jgi:hypothetical protein
MQYGSKEPYGLASSTVLGLYCSDQGVVECPHVVHK